MFRHLIVAILCVNIVSCYIIPQTQGAQRSSAISVKRAKFIFKVRTESGGIVGGILIEGKDLFDCINKLMRRYPNCQILEAKKK